MSALSREQLAAKVAAAIAPHSYVNLGIGWPTLVADFLKPEQHVVLHSENGMLGMGPQPPSEQADWELINAGKQPVSLLPGGAFLDHVDSFSIMRGGHLDVAIMGGFEVSLSGDLANWRTNDRDAIPAVGGAMDLVAGGQALWVMMALFDKHHQPKLLQRCTYPLTGQGCVTRLYTDWASFERHEGQLKLLDWVSSTSPQQLSQWLGLELSKR